MSSVRKKTKEEIQSNYWILHPNQHNKFNNGGDIKGQLADNFNDN